MMCPSTLSGSSSSEVSNISNRSHSPGGASDTVAVVSLGGVDLGDAAAINLCAAASAAAAAVDLRGAPVGLLRGVCVGVRVLGWVPVGGVLAVCDLKVNSCSISFNPISSAMVLTSSNLGIVYVGNVYVMTMARLACRVLCCVCVCFALFVIFVSSCLLLYFFVICASFLYGISFLWNQLLTESTSTQQTKFILGVILGGHVHSSLPCFDSFEI